MQIASRPHLAAGVAMVGASLIAVSPVAQSVQPTHLPYALTAAIESPDTVFAPVGDQVQKFVEDVVDRFATNPAPLPRQLLATALNSTEVLFADPFNVTDQAITDLHTAIDGFGSRLAAFSDTTSAAATATNDALSGLLAGLPDALAVAGDLVAAGNPTGAVDSIVQSGMQSVVNLLLFGVNPEINAVGQLFNIPQPFVDATSNAVFGAVIGLAAVTIGVGAPLDGYPAPLVQQAIAGTQEIASSLVSANPVNVVNALQHSTSGMLASLTYTADTVFNMAGAIEDGYALAVKQLTPPRPIKLPNALSALTAAPETTAPETAALKTTATEASTTKALKASESTEAADDTSSTTTAKADTNTADKTDATPAVKKVHNPGRSFRDRVKSTVSKVTGAKSADAAGKDDAAGTKADAPKGASKGAHRASHKASGKGSNKASHKGSGKRSHHS